MISDDISKNIQAFGATSKFLDNLFLPFNTLRQAKAEIQAENNKQIARFRRDEEEIWHQQNLEKIAEKAKNYFEEGDAVELLHPDWAAKYLEKAKNYSDEDMQHIWAKILAEELKHPGSYSRKTINILDDLEKSDAELFTHLCSFGVMIHEDNYPTLLLYNIVTSSKYSQPYSMEKKEIMKLDALGLIRYETWTSYSRRDLPSSFEIKYFSNIIKVDGNLETFATSHIELSKFGLELYNIVERSYNQEFFSDLPSLIKNNNPQIRII